ncbi:Lrp/AsnC family transcriptional regulator [Defluviimonas sp. WL0024]|uniref:Lrp/AsnC family transcriptional regulator n=2 Tax=Albidovulum TaxID=205889 RepID=A0ABT3IY69_9RHOB|nr:Lrp/AsnC family transcriptional regulator [Defluviimonas sp. WL0024]MCU9846754.1 Lrp/AsnC family transcriptional regulator [Defluviimonas sp. WL0024]MCW3780386.1 Lrp/AsnC family transcriptional regulator [Defluviimonas salinarum]MCW3784678.1 Lrp/AsnC family transcriptional regulator [Defluviimonas salinarum]
MKPLDSTDIRILRTLLREGNIPNTKLSELVALSTSQCWQRVQRLQRDGYIEGYNAVINHRLLGYSDIVLVEISAARDEVTRIAELCEELSKIPEVLEVHLTSGEYDCFIKVAVDGTRGYENFLNKKLYRIKGVRNSRSSFSLKCFKNETGFVPDML